MHINDVILAIVNQRKVSLKGGGEGGLTVDGVELVAICKGGVRSDQSRILQRWDGGQVGGEVLAKHEAGGLVYNSKAQYVLPVDVLGPVVRRCHFLHTD
jgi:hypothetical protein